MNHAISDNGENDPIPFDLGSWLPVAGKVREHLEETMERVLTQVDV